MQHTTPLISHLRQLHFWLDLGLLALSGLLAYYFPVLKVVPIIAGLEFLSFLTFHSLPAKKSMNIQGFLGGLVSSTAVFVQLLFDVKFKQTYHQELINALLLALSAMLMECLVILYAFVSLDDYLYFLPFAIQLLLILAWLIQQQVSRPERGTTSKNTDIALSLEMDHPILWKNVLKLSLLITALVWIMQTAGSFLSHSKAIATTFIALFEAHAVLAAVLTDWQLHPASNNLLLLCCMILLGNTLSKSYLIYRSPNLTHKERPLAVIFISFLISIALTGVITLLSR